MLPIKPLGNLFSVTPLEFLRLDGQGETYHLEAAATSDGRLVFDPNGGKGGKGEIYPEYHHRDHLGNTRVAFTDRDEDGKVELLGANSEVVQHLDYYPFGMMQDMSCLYPAGNSDNRYRYNGKEFSEELGLYDYGARWYDPAIGRFTSIDPHASNYPHATTYGYVENNPILRIDPDGRDWVISIQQGAGKGGRDIVSISINVSVRDERSTKDFSEKKIARREKQAQKFSAKLEKQIERSFKGRDRNTEFVTNATVSVANSDSEVGESDHVVRLVDNISEVDSSRPEESVGFAEAGENFAYVENQSSLTDMVKIASHELGHTARLDHIKDETAFPNARKPGKARRLNTNDYPGNLMHQNSDRNSVGKSVQGTSITAWQLIKMRRLRRSLNGGKQKF